MMHITHFFKSTLGLQRCRSRFFWILTSMPSTCVWSMCKKNKTGMLKSCRWGRWLTLLPFSGRHLQPALQSRPAHGSSNFPLPCERERDRHQRQLPTDKRCCEMLFKVRHFRIEYLTSSLRQKCNVSSPSFFLVLYLRRAARRNCRCQTHIVASRRVQKCSFVKSVCYDNPKVWNYTLVLPTEVLIYTVLHQV